jgi:hypothetical protein
MPDRMSRRQKFALEHPASRAEDALRPELAATQTHRTGVLVRTILAVDR